ncbi:hypothetical protein UB37_12055 [Photobacterium iliopiscarium]|uniref:Uncharacterized protein n=1 Tax=Photobacterium iliopiscarium TaxID=56192 RepID=A0A0D8P6R7_9GAMM|nr:hypothetical protein [Photobacterium iliopiscarium]KJG14596.1 hypothetical protein UB38_03195 [Photobacterium iliopiscarium]KJG21074.1 hypothetical protein UB37_12055 [Photobacterium iliopiscarium]PSU00332.1 hypothetical protein C9I85_08260 [Photobacterium iliopiscarium]PSV84865.1 hypothetical protein C9J51_00865 [Photobacterium iliopiscarium]PSV99713.1 hypothetical protein C9I88_00700 [Photobacterium iliopiscarium]
MSINSIDYSEMSAVSSKWEHKDDSATNIADSKKQQGAARRRIEMLRDIQASGLTLAEARELGLLH